MHTNKPYQAGHHHRFWLLAHRRHYRTICTTYDMRLPYSAASGYREAQHLYYMIGMPSGANIIRHLHALILMVAQHRLELLVLQQLQPLPRDYQP